MHRLASSLLVALTIVLALPSGAAIAEVQKSLDAQGRVTLSGDGSANPATAPAPPAPAGKDAAGSDSAGRIELVEGDVTLYDAAKKARAARVGDAVLQGDSIVTGKDGELHLEMADGGFVAVRPNTKMRIVEFRAEGDDKDKGIFGLLQGSLRSITGWIGKSNPAAYRIRTPSATIGIRGTDHEPLVIPQGASDGEPGTYDKVNAGGSFIETKHGRVDVPLGRAAFSPHSAKAGKAAPRLLAEVPRFFRGSRNEQRIQSRHEAIQQRIQQLREERRKHLSERRAEVARRLSERQHAQREQRRTQNGERLKQRQEQSRNQREERVMRRQEQRQQQRRPQAEERGREERREAQEPNRAGARQRLQDGADGHRRREP